jgi:hypothetical protein
LDDESPSECLPSHLVHPRQRTHKGRFRAIYRITPRKRRSRQLEDAPGFFTVASLKSDRRLKGNIMPNWLGSLSFGMSGLEDFFGFGY